MNIVEYNNIIKQKHENFGGIELLGKYVVSEILSPIEDFENAVNIIRKNYKNGVNSTILIIGAYLISEWLDNDNEMLRILNSIQNYLPIYEQAIISFLNAHHLLFQDENYKDNPKYENYLLDSIGKCDAPFVNNRLYLARLYNGKKAKKLYEEALSNIVKVNSLIDIKTLKLENYVNPESYIREFITGTYISYINYESICYESINTI